MNIDFLTPVDIDANSYNDLGQKGLIGQSIKIYSNQENFPDLDNVSIVIFGVKEGRRAIRNNGCGQDLSNIRNEFYKLFPGKWAVELADIGNVEAGNTVEDTYFAVSSLMNYLLKKNIIPFVLGGGQDLTYAMYRGYDNLEQTVNLVSVDSKFDLGAVEDEMLSNTYLSKIIMNQPNNLFNFSNIGYQTYFNHQDEIDLLESLYFDTYRVGEVKSVQVVEPVMRDADIVSVDLGVVKKSDAPGNMNSPVNGLNGEHICAIARYAGISDKVSSFGIFEYNSFFDIENQTASLIAQVIWYFIEGFNYRAKDYPYSTKEDYQKFSVVLEEDEPMNFYKSHKSGRWWMEINLITDNKHKRHTLIPCTYNDYKDALDQIIPKRWYKAQQKMI